MNISLVAVNSQYIHTNLAVRSIAACLRQGGFSAAFAEFTINQRQPYILQQLYRQGAGAYFFSVYIWNVELVCALAADLRKLCPKALLLAGGPQVTYHTEAFLRQNPAFNAVLTGEGEESVVAFCKAVKSGAGFETVPGIVFLQNGQAVSTPGPAPLCMDSLPFAYQDIQQLAGRILYYESMRGCPFGCSYCLSSLEKGVRFKALAIVEKELARLLLAKPKQVKFVDRTFNCNKSHALGIWRFLAENDNGYTNFHFELAGELLEEEMLAFLHTVRPGLFQFEIGVQSTNAETLREINRPANVPHLFEKVDRLKNGGNIHLHLDLIAGLPEENYESFASSFNRVYAKQPHQFQLGFLKVLPGSIMEQKAKEYGLVWQTAAPFEVLYTNWLSYDELCELKQMAEMVEVYYNSGRFAHITAHICGMFATPFIFYRQLAAFYVQQGHAHAPLGKIGYYQLLGSFMRQSGFEPDEKAQWLCKLDLALHEKIKSLPAWVTVGNAAAYKEEILAFYAKPQNIARYLPQYAGREAKQIRNMAHIEIFPFQPFTGEARSCALLFNYEERNILGNATVWEIAL